MNYDYGCQCGEREVIDHGMNEDPEFLCGHCGEKMERIITGGNGVLFKGEGWTHTDQRYRRAAHGEPLKPNAKSKKRVMFGAGLTPRQGQCEGKGH